MFDRVKTVRLDSLGHEIVEWWPEVPDPEGQDTPDIAEIVADIEEMYPGALISAKYVS